MTSLHRHARFDLFVTALTAIAVAALYLWSGNPSASMAGFALLALSGVRAALRRGATPVQDERDEAILQRANVTGYSALWLGLVAWGVVAPLRFAEAGSVPLAWVAPVVWVAWWLVTLVRSITILALDRPVA